MKEASHLSEELHDVVRSYQTWYQTQTEQSPELNPTQRHMLQVIEANISSLQQNIEDLNTVSSLTAGTAGGGNGETTVPIKSIRKKIAEYYYREDVLNKVMPLLTLYGVSQFENSQYEKVACPSCRKEFTGRNYFRRFRQHYRDKHSIS